MQTSEGNNCKLAVTCPSLQSLRNIFIIFHNICFDGRFTELQDQKQYNYLRRLGELQAYKAMVADHDRQTFNNALFYTISSVRSLFNTVIDGHQTYQVELEWKMKE